jgi:nucleotide-binding universal stress UspA family protein
MFKKILLAIDGSEESKKAEDYAVELAKAMNGSITAINVVEISSAIASAGSDVFYPQALGDAMALDIMKENSESLLNEFKEKQKNKGIEITTISAMGHVWNEVIEESERGNYSLIVLGSKGLSGITRMLIGSVAENVARHSKCPVLIVK